MSNKYLWKWYTHTFVIIKQTTYIYNKQFNLITTVNNTIIDAKQNIAILSDFSYFDIKSNKIFDKGNFITFIDDNKILEKYNDSLIIKKIETINI